MFIHVSLVCAFHAQPDGAVTVNPPDPPAAWKLEFEGANENEQAAAFCRDVLNHWSGKAQIGQPAAQRLPILAVPMGDVGRGYAPNLLKRAEGELNRLLMITPDHKEAQLLLDSLPKK